MMNRHQLEGMQARAEGKSSDSNPYERVNGSAKFSDDWQFGWQTMDTHINSTMSAARYMVEGIESLRKSRPHARV